MTSEAPPETIEEQVLAGGDDHLRRLAAEGLLPLSPERLIRLQVQLARDADSEVGTLAATALREIEPRIAAPVLARETDVAVLEFFAANADHPLLLETVARSRAAPVGALRDLASRSPGEVQEVLILRQDAILEEPGILDALEENAALLPAVRRRISEYREHLLPRQAAAEPEPVEEPAEDLDATPEEVEREIAAAAALEVEGEVDRQTGLSEGQIRTLSVPVRLQLARGAGRTLRDILIRDPNPMVASATLLNNTFSDSEVERIARMRTVAEEVLEAIGRTPQWVRKYPIALALVKNPRTPIPMGVGLVPRLAVRDLRLVRTDRNISEAVRNRANRLFLQKMK